MTKKLLENLGFLFQMGLCILPVQSFLAYTLPVKTFLYLNIYT